MPLHFFRSITETYNKELNPPTPFLQIPQGWFPESLRECRFLPLIMIVVLPMFTLRPFASRCFFQFPSLESNSFIVSASSTRSSVYKSSDEQLVRNSCDKTSRTMMNNNGLSTEPGWTPSCTWNRSVNKLFTLHLTSGILIITCITRTTHSGTPAFRRAHH